VPAGAIPGGREHPAARGDHPADHVADRRSQERDIAALRRRMIPRVKAGSAEKVVGAARRGDG